MKYKIIVDKQSRTNPSTEKREYEIDIEELRCKGDVYDSLVITKDEDYVMRRLSLSKYGVLSVLEEPIKEDLTDINIKLFEGDNYIYLIDMVGNKFYAEYLIKNDFTDTFVTENQMNSAINQTAQNIELSVNQKLKGYSTTEEMNSAIDLKAGEITQEVNKKVNENELGTKITQNYEAVKFAWNQISQYLKMEGINGKATLNIYDKNNKMLMSLSNTGQKFYRSDGTEIGDIGLITDSDGKNQLVFSLNTESSRDGMAWGIKNSQGKFFPIFQMVAFDYAEQSEYGGYFQMVATLDMLNNEIKLMDTKIVGEAVGGISIYDENGNTYLNLGPDNFSMCNAQIKFYQNNLGNYTLSLNNNSIANVYMLSAETISATDVVADTVIETSNKKRKKYIKSVNKKATEIIKEADICQYQFKGEKTSKHRHLGLVIGEGYNCPDEVISENKEGIEIYSMITLSWKAIQEQQEQIEKLKESDKQKDKKIAELIKRLERLEASNGKN